MMKRSQRIVATVVLAALATTGTASAGTSGSDPKPGAADSGAKAKADGKAKPTAEADFAAIAAKLGVTTDRLVAALDAAKRSLAGRSKVTAQAFVAAVAANLGLPVSRVAAAVEPMLVQPGRPRPGDKAPKAPKGKAGQDPKSQPFASNAAAAQLAAKLGVSRAKAKAALITVVSAPNGITPTSKAFRQIAASLGVSPDRLMTALGELKRALATG
jgi:hypothetical protein